jgi:hypothetical protein
VTGARVARGLLGVSGAGLAVYGTVRLFQEPAVADPWDVVRWTVGALLLRDAGFAPVVLVAGVLVTRALPGAGPPPWVRRTVLGGLAVGTAATVVSLPALLVPRPTPNWTVLPLDYPRNLGPVWAVVAAGTAVVVLARARGGRRG